MIVSCFADRSQATNEDDGDIQPLNFRPRIYDRVDSETDGNVVAVFPVQIGYTLPRLTILYCPPRVNSHSIRSS